MVLIFTIKSYWSKISKIFLIFGINGCNLAGLPASQILSVPDLQYWQENAGNIRKGKGTDGFLWPSGQGHITCLHTHTHSITTKVSQCTSMHTRTRPTKWFLLLKYKNDNILYVTLALFHTHTRCRLGKRIKCCVDISMLILSPVGHSANTQQRYTDTANTRRSKHSFL